MSVLVYATPFSRPCVGRDDMTRKRTLLTVAVAVLVVLAGCASFGGTGGDAAQAGGDGGGEALSESRDSGGGDGGDGDGGDAQSAGGGDGDGQAAVSGQPRQVDRKIIRTGTVELRVDDHDSARSAIADRARNLGGYVSGSGSTQHTRDNESWTTGYVVVRVPSDRFSDVLSHARDRGAVLNEGTQTEDVTDQLVDLEARLTNLEQRRDRLRSFYDQANTTSELLRIEEQLSSVQSEIEQLEAQKRSLEDRVAFATLRVELSEPEPSSSSGDEDPTFRASLVSAFQGSIATLANLASGFVLFSVRLAPFVLFLGLPALAVGLAVRRRSGLGLPWTGGPGDEDIQKPGEAGDSRPESTRDDEPESEE